MDITELIGIPLAALLRLCQDLLQNYGAAIVVFTLLTKVILLPVSAWVQRNSIALVALTPELERMKLRFYGDKDTIAEETLKIYKKRGYHPFLSSVPMLVQLVMLLGVIGAVKSVLGEVDTPLAAMPYEAGGWTLLMPLLAGLAALALGLGQNKLNPLQREQTKTEQWMANGFSIAISLVLGAFVSVGVGIYWIASNLLSIAQQALLNVLVDPKKYIDYADLAAARKEKEAVEGLNAGATKENKKREKADYKRFFSVAGKHLVFYSEGSGFYKYFKDVIEYLLEKSNLTIHYVTVDPDDQIFAIAEKEPRIRAYYIGPTRLITLFMKMDADIVVMTCPDLNNFHLKRSYVRKDIEYIYMFHYPLSTHMVLNTGALDHYDTVFCVGQFQFDEIRAAEKLYNTKEKKLIAAGYGQLEQLHKSFLALEKTENSRPKVVIAPSWQADNILDSCIEALLTELLGKGFDVTVRPHPEYIKRYKPRMDKIVERWQGAEDLTFELNFAGNASIFGADALITDWSGTAYEYSFVTLRPAVFIDTAPKINNPDYEKLGIEPLEFSLRSQVGLRIDPKALEGLSDRLRAQMEDREAHSQRLQALRDTYIANFGTSGKVGARYILQQLKAKKEKTL